LSVGFAICGVLSPQTTYGSHLFEIFEATADLKSSNVVQILYAFRTKANSVSKSVLPGLKLDKPGYAAIYQEVHITNSSEIASSVPQDANYCHA
jgi:hypothetical protein